MNSPRTHLRDYGRQGDRLYPGALWPDRLFLPRDCQRTFEDPERELKSMRRRVTIAFSDELGRLALPYDPDLYPTLAFYGRISFLKAGICWADAITTVSPNCRREVLTPEYGSGFDGLLREKRNRLRGIMNGADYGIWDPANDVHLTMTFTPRQVSLKRACKAARRS